MPEKARPHTPPRERPRKPGHNAYYQTPRWKAISRAIRTLRPVCEGCKRAASQCVDHIRARERGGSDDPENLRALCWRCHSAKTAKQDGGFGNPIREVR